MQSFPSKFLFQRAFIFLRREGSRIVYLSHLAQAITVLVKHKPCINCEVYFIHHISIFGYKLWKRNKCTFYWWFFQVFFWILSKTSALTPRLHSMHGKLSLRNHRADQNTSVLLYIVLRIVSLVSLSLIAIHFRHFKLFSWVVI